jgi:hypothetical protein
MCKRLVKYIILYYIILYKMMNTVTGVFIFQCASILFFAILYSLIPPDNFVTLNNDSKVMPIDYLFYSVTIQSGIGLPDITSQTQMSKAIAIVQQFTVLASTMVIVDIFLRKQK